MVVSQIISLHWLLVVMAPETTRDDRTGQIGCILVAHSISLWNSGLEHCDPRHPRAKTEHHYETWTETQKSIRHCGDIAKCSKIRNHRQKATTRGKTTGSDLLL
ncbi:hypothetical protein B0H19DRAFT_1162031, partial [Mycena capillaripes]